MPKTKFILAVSILLLATLACNTLLPATEPPSSLATVIVESTFPVGESGLPATEAEVPRVSLEQALTAHSAGAAVFVDVRTPESYEISHIPGAINIPLGVFETDIANVDLDQDDWIITYCT
jgi:3-mercaptopyruvate sulfurtransferase SseA